MAGATPLSSIRQWRDVSASNQKRRPLPVLSKTQLNDLLNHLTAATLLVEAKGNVLYLNAAGEQMLGISLRQIAGHTLADALSPDVLTPLVARALESGRSYAHRELALARIGSTGGELIVDCMLTPMPSQGAVLVELHDARPRIRFDRDAALSIQQGVSRSMVRQLAHEIKNPLGGLRGAAQLLERRLPQGGLQDYTGVIMREADRLTVLVDKLLGPATAPSVEQVNIHELLHDVQRLIEAEAPPGVIVRVDFDPSLPSVLIDRDEMVQACLNLARNALQALPPTGWILFRTRAITQATIQDRRYSLGVRIDVEDNGPGVSEQLQETMFYPLVSGRRDGTGIGLPVAQELVRRQGGVINYSRAPADHEHPVARTVFSICLPLELNQ